MVEVDLRLFVTCRLCLDVQGHFQIDPTVQQQIKYCFDIDVEPFDGLPQLICKNCEIILKEHYATKKTFTEKQKELKTKLRSGARKVKKSPSPQPEVSGNRNGVNKTKRHNRLSAVLDDSDSSVIEKGEEEKLTRKKKKVKKRRKVHRLISSSGDEVNISNSTKTQSTVHSINDNLPSWDTNLNKYFVCKICSEGFQDKEDIKKHTKKHNLLLMKYRNIFKMNCLVVMEKSDKKPNICNSNKAVVYSLDSIIQNEHNPYYYIKYFPKSYSDIPSTFRPMLEEQAEPFDSTDSERLTSKKRRLSRSSGETVVINRHSEHEDKSHIKNMNNPQRVIDCIDIGDSSDNGSCESNDRTSSSMSKGNQVSKPMHNIVKMCYNKYIKQIDQIEKSNSQNDRGKDNSLQHKVLSIGRKIINNKGFNCTGLLRFLEYKDLSVIWIETNVRNAASIDGKYVRIATKLRENDGVATSSVGWKNFSDFKFDYEDNYLSLNILSKLKALVKLKKESNQSPVTKQETDKNTSESLPRISSVFSHTDLEITKTDSDNLLQQKLLNENPVLNPKQLPKKVNTNESYSKSIKVFSAPNSMPFAGVKQTDKDKNVDGGTNMLPIVTSAVSLAHLCDAKANVSTKKVAEISQKQQTYPRIKVKPVSELMPEKSTLNNKSNVGSGGHSGLQLSDVVWFNQDVNLNTQQTFSSQPNSLTPTNPHTNMWQNPNQSVTTHQGWPSNTHFCGQNSTSAINKPLCSNESDSLKEYIVLDTVEFPNTKTKSPFQYFKDLLLVHNIILLDVEQTPPEGSASLIKFKLVYTQDKCESICLCLSLFCKKNVFCIQISDSNDSKLYMTSLSANWQWQLLKVYNSQVIMKVLHAAQSLGKETYTYTNEFFSVLKSIKLKSDM